MLLKKIVYPLLFIFRAICYICIVPLLLSACVIVFIGWGPKKSANFFEYVVYLGLPIE